MKLASSGFVAGTPLAGKLEETHISWVILTRKFPYKIKKTIRLSFLDFSTLALRKRYCELEVSLNSRFSNIYLRTDEIRLDDRHWHIGSGEGKLMDYCVVMKRLAQSKKMQSRLQRNAVAPNDMAALAAEVAEFHKRAKKIFTPFKLDTAKSTFNNIEEIRAFTTQHIGKEFANVITRAIAWSDHFLEKYQAIIGGRIEAGFLRDVHGDLHSGNIFLYRRPVLFDCIEFNDAYRQIDVLYEVAFLCMDLESFQARQLSRVFLKEYNNHMNCFRQKEDKDLFNYFKCLRANIRAKVHAVSACQADTAAEFALHVADTTRYLMLMNEYMGSNNLP